MYINRTITTSTESYWNKIKKANELIQSAEYILIGAGAGMSASGGLDYTDPELCKRWFPDYYEMGLHTISDIQAATHGLTESSARTYWGYWANHIYHIRYETKLLQPYKTIMELIKDKNYYICTTNVDSQFEKAGVPKDKIFAPQGNYSLFQCSTPCSDEVFYNEKMIEKMRSNIQNKQIRKEDIPRCPICNKLLMPNLRCDFRFVEKPHMKNSDDYQKFVDNAVKHNFVLVELGVGFNTPGIIRFPFENITSYGKNTRLIRINLSDASVPHIIGSKSIMIEENIQKVLLDLLKSAKD